MCDAARSEVHQLVVVKHASVFVNSGTEATRVFNELKTKGPIYHAYRFFSQLPDWFASDQEDWKKRFDHMGEALNAIQMESEVDITKDLLDVLSKASESGESLDISKTFTLMGFDMVSKAVFGYDLGGVKGTEEERRSSRRWRAWLKSSLVKASMLIQMPEKSVRKRRRKPKQLGVIF